MSDGYNLDDIAQLRNLEAIRLEQARYACPEQYDALVDGRQVGYWSRSATRASPGAQRGSMHRIDIDYATW
jgi:hypothetical protein